MKICFHAPVGPLTNLLRQCVEAALKSKITDLSELPAKQWKEIVGGADLVIADVTSQNAATFYLAGICDALGKRTILLAAINESIPATFADRPVILHQWNFELLKSELQKFATPDADEASSISDDTPAGKFQQRFGDLLRTHGYVHRGEIEFDGSTFTVRDQDMELALVQAIAHRAKSLNLRVRLL